VRACTCACERARVRACVWWWWWRRRWRLRGDARRVAVVAAVRLHGRVCVRVCVCVPALDWSAYVTPWPVLSRHTPLVCPCGHFCADKASWPRRGTPSNKTWINRLWRGLPGTGPHREGVGVQRVSAVVAAVAVAVACARAYVRARACVWSIHSPPTAVEVPQ